MSFLQGSPLPNVTTTESKTQTAPDYYTSYLKDLATAGTGALGKTGAELVAGYDPLQTTGYGQYETAAGSYKDQLEKAQSNIGDVAGGLTSARIANLMDPYQKQVTDEMARLAQQSVQRQLLPSMKVGAVGSGNLGGQRYAGALGQALADVQSNLTGQQYGALSKGYQSALDAALKELDLQRLAGVQQESLAKTEQGLGLAGAQALTKAGAERQAYEQAQIDAPLTRALNVAKLMSGYQVPMSTSTTAIRPAQQGEMGLSGMQKISTIGSLFGAASEGKFGGALSSFLNKISSTQGETPYEFTPEELQAFKDYAESLGDFEG